MILINVYYKAGICSKVHYTTIVCIRAIDTQNKVDYLSVLMDIFENYVSKRVIFYAA